VILGLLVVPLPVSRVRTTAVVQLQHDALHRKYAEIPGVLEKLHVKDGQIVEENQLLAELTSREIDTQLLEAQTQYTIHKDQLSALTVQLTQAGDFQSQGRVKSEIADVKGRLVKDAKEVDVYLKMKDTLNLRAPMAGVVMNSPKVNEIGKLWEKGQEVPFCSIGDPTRLRATFAVTPIDDALLKEDWDDLAKAKTLFTVGWLGIRVTNKGIFPVGNPENELPVTIRVHGRDSHTWHGRLEELPESEAREVPAGLTHKGGGSLAVKPGTRPGVYVPQAQVYLVNADFIDTPDAPLDGAIHPGTLAQVKIDCKWRSCAWWAYRTVSSLFDLKLSL